MIKPLTRPTQTFDLLTPEQEICHKFMHLIKVKTTDALLDGRHDYALYLMELYDKIEKFAREVMEE